MYCRCETRRWKEKFKRSALRGGRTKKIGAKLEGVGRDDWEKGIGEDAIWEEYIF